MEEVSEDDEEEGGAVKEWTLEWLETLSEAEVKALDQTRLMKFLLETIDEDDEWSRVPDEPVFDPSEDQDEKEGFYSEATTEKIFGKMPDIDFDPDDEDYETDAEEEDEELTEADMAFLKSMTETDLDDGEEGTITYWGDDGDEDEGEVEEAEMDDEEEDVEDDGGEEDEDEDSQELWEESEGRQGRTSARSPPDSGKLRRVREYLDAVGAGKAKRDPALVAAAVQSCLEADDMEAASGLLQRMEDMGLELGDLEEKAGFRPATRSSAKLGPDDLQALKRAALSEEDTARVAVGQLTSQQLSSMQAQGACVGIDLGTTFSAVSIVQDGQAMVLPSRTTGRTVTPSVVRFQPVQVQVGDAALGQLLTDTDNSFSSVKRLIGRSLQELLKEKEVLATVNVVQRGGSVAMYCPALGREVTPQEVSAEVIRSLIADAATYLNATVNRAVITVPAYFTPEQCEATEEAGKLAGPWSGQGRYGVGGMGD
jgi:hypothetical protein